MYRASILDYIEFTIIVLLNYFWYPVVPDLRITEVSWRLSQVSFGKD